MSTAVSTASTSKTDGILVVASAAIIVALWAVGIAIY